MAGTMQQFWKHDVPKTRNNVGERINLTFRKITQAESLAAGLHRGRSP